MDTWLTIRTFIAVFLGAFGIGLMFVRTEDNRMVAGALFLSIGLTFLFRMAIEFRHR